MCGHDGELGCGCTPCAAAFPNALASEQGASKAPAAATAAATGLAFVEEQVQSLARNLLNLKQPICHCSFGRLLGPARQRRLL